MILLNFQQKNKKKRAEHNLTEAHLLIFKIKYNSIGI